jgi:hypothetical protein
VAVRSKASVCGRWNVEVSGPNPAECMDMSFLFIGALFKQRALRRDAHSSRVVLPFVYVSNCVCDLETSKMRRPDFGCCLTEEIYFT